jgi:subfamily B ATP-binding cassette protein MsbA
MRRLLPRLPAGEARRLLGYTRPYRVQLGLAIVSTLIGSLMGLAFPRVVGQLVDAVFAPLGTQATGASGDTSGLDHAVVLLIGVAVLQALFTALQTYLLAVVGEGVVADVRRAVYSHLLGLPVRFFESRKTGEITSRLTADAAMVQSSVSSSLAQLLSTSLTLLGGLALLVATSWKLSLVMLAVIPLVVLLATFFGRRMHRVSAAVQDRLADANAGASEAISGIRVVQSFVAEDLERARYAALIQSAFHLAKRRAWLRTAFGPGVMMLGFFAVTLVLWVGGRLVLAGELSAGGLVSFLLYTFAVAGALGQFAGLYSTLQEALGASSRRFGVLDEQAADLAQPAQPVALVAPRGAVRLDGVWFHYPDRQTAVLQDVSLEVAPGEVVALVGPSGAGKSTLVSLLPRFYDPTAGRLLLDGTDLREFDLYDLRRHIGIVPQETHLFSGTVEENIRYGRPDASVEEVYQAARDANADAFVRGLEAGYATLVGERGVKLSGGQRQRIAIARALLKDPRILIMDEATSSLDSETEWLVQEALRRLMRGRTTFVIAHRLSTVRGADRVVVLDRGRVVQSGDHATLLAEGGLYARLYERQFSDLAPLKMV